MRHASRIIGRPATVLAAALATVLGAAPAMAAATAAAICPPFSFANAVNYALNPSFEDVGAAGPTSTCPSPCVITKPSAASNWTMHSDNIGSAVSTSLVSPSTVPPGTGPAAGARMLRVTAGGNEGGVFQSIVQPPTGRVMITAWVYVIEGKVSMTMNTNNLGPAAYSTKTGQWEQLRICDALGVPNDVLAIYNQIPAAQGGGEFFLDRVEIRAMLANSP